MKFSGNGGMPPNHILVSRTDAIGDVVLTLPLCGLLKRRFPSATISFLGRSYTEPVVACCSAVDRFVDIGCIDEKPEAEQVSWLRNIGADVILHVHPNPQVAKLAAKAGIALRVGTRNRLYHWFTCNKLVALSRRRSPLHEAELNLRVLAGLGVNDFPALGELAGLYDFQPSVTLPPAIAELLAKDKFNLILHPKSHGSGAEWGLDSFAALVQLLDHANFRVFVTGSGKERPVLVPWLAALPGNTVIDMTGALSLGELIAFIAEADGLVASGTGPLHLAAAAGIHTLGLFPATQPINIRRWAPVGKQAVALNSGTDDMNDLLPQQVAAVLNSWLT